LNIATVSSSTSLSRTPCASVEVGAHEAFGVLHIEDVGGDAQAELVRLVDHRTIDLRRHLLVLIVAGIDPDLDDVDLLRRELLHRLATLLLSRDPVRHRDATGLGHGDAASGAEETGGARNDLAAHVEHVVFVGAEAERRAHAEIAAPLQVACDHLERRAQVNMGIDDGRHHGLAGQIHAVRAGRHGDVGGAAGLQDLRVPSTTSFPFSIGAAPSPTMSRAPSNAVMPPAGACARVRPEDCAKRTAMAAVRLIGFVRYMESSPVSCTTA
jgi:hypothetical protein